MKGFNNKCENWEEMEINRLDKCSLNQLLNNQISYIRIPGFVNAAERALLVKSIDEQAFGFYENVEPKIDRIGCTVFEFFRAELDSYFDESERQIAIRDKIFSGSVDVLNAIINMIATNAGMKVGVAHSESGKPYYAGLMRKIEQGTELHIDFAPAEQKGWEVCDVDSQLAFNLYLQTPDDDSGMTRIYDRAWTEQDNELKDGFYGFSDDVIKDAGYVDFKPEAGDLILFNTKNYHQVFPSSQARLTFSSAIGRLPSKELIIWS